VQRTQIILTVRHHVALTLLAVLMAGTDACIAADPMPAANAVKSCCATLASLPSATSWVNEHKLSLSPQSPHFDFGQGLAPFVHLSLSPAAVAIELRAHGMGMIGKRDYVDVRLVFLDADREPLPGVTVLPAKLESVGWASTRMFVANIAVPVKATSVLITSNPGTAGQQGQATIRAGDSAVIISGIVVPLPGGMATVQYALSSYGDVTVVSHPGAIVRRGAPDSRRAQALTVDTR
jgi:hypothetical protein